MSAGPERVFSGAKYIIGIERILLRAKMLEMAELLKSWVLIIAGRKHAPLRSVFANRYLLNKAIKVLEGGGDNDSTITLSTR